MIVFEILCIALQVYVVILIVRIVLSYVTRLPEPLIPARDLVVAVTEPILGPLRRLIPPARLGGGAFDFSPLIAFFGVQLLQIVICPLGA